MTIEELDLSVRSYNCLKRAGINTVQELTQKTEEDMMKVCMIICKTERELEIMREAGKIVALTHQALQPHIKPGVTTIQLDKIAEEFIRSHDASPSFKTSI